jgi:hypothetical protein
VSAQAHISYIKEDVLNAQTDILGKIINVKLAHALSKIYKSLEVENDRFILLLTKNSSNILKLISSVKKKTFYLI